jgi:hypothetical protein
MTIALNPSLGYVATEAVLPRTMRTGVAVAKLGAALAVQLPHSDSPRSTSGRSRSPRAMLS